MFSGQKTLTSFFKTASTSQTQAQPNKSEKQTKNLNDVVPGLSLTTNFITEAEEKFLWQELNKFPWRDDIKRRYQVHGYKYDGETKSKLERAGDMPSCLFFLMDRITEENIMPEKPEQCVINEYEPGVGIHPHIDSTLFGDQVINISLGADIVMDFYSPGDEQKKSVLLPRRSLLLKEGKARFDWKHGIAYRKSDKLEDGMVLKRNKRISITFRLANKDAVKKYINNV